LNDYSPFNIIIMDILPLITVIVSGAIGGNLAGSFMPKVSMGKITNTIVGAIGGGLGGYLFDMVGMSGSGVPGSGANDFRNIATTFFAGSLSGGTVMLIIGYVKQMMSKK
jgi:uncharacterized membrane protein YeaQ/YmgE (transglycosylase-associated protein family)